MTSRSPRPKRIQQSVSTPGEPGVYQLRLRLAEPVRIQIGRLGMFDFPAGDYIYTGSAMGGLTQRLARHRRSDKPLHWHIDYLRQYATIVGVDAIQTSERLECVLNRSSLGSVQAQVVAPGFGSSDCRCISHLVYLGVSRAWLRAGDAVEPSRGRAAQRSGGSARFR